MIAWVIAEVTGSPPSGPPSTVVYLLAAALGGGVIAQLISLTLRRQQRDSLIADASEQAVKNVLSLMEEYRRELGEARTQIAALQERIVKLEQQIATARNDREKLVKELSEAIEARVHAEQRVSDLEDRISILEAKPDP